MRPAFVAVALLICASSARAQSDTTEGVDAFVRGDYRRAAGILKPIAEQSAQQDSVAAFFMAAMYDSGLGIFADPIRACALYLRADGSAFNGDRSPFGAQAMALMTIRRATLSREAFEECTWMASNGFDHGFEPVTFVLGPGHWIAWDIKGATITYDGTEKRIQAPLVRNRFAILPLRYTELAVGPTRSQHRHFIEILTWEPTGVPQEWTLRWSLREVVKDTLIGVASAPLTTVAAPRAPADRFFDVRSTVRLAVNDEGDAGWALLVGSNRQATVMDTEADRVDQEEDRVQSRARAALDARADGRRRVDRYRTPALAYVDGRTCGGAFIGWSPERTEEISIAPGETANGAAARAGTFDLARPGSPFGVVVHVHDRPEGSAASCSDTGRDVVDETWRAIRGVVTIDRARRGDERRVGPIYRITVRVEGAEFVNGAGVHVTQAQPIVLTMIGR